MKIFEVLDLAILIQGWFLSHCLLPLPLNHILPVRDDIYFICPLWVISGPQDGKFTWQCLLGYSGTKPPLVFSRGSTETMRTQWFGLTPLLHFVSNHLSCHIFVNLWSTQRCWPGSCTFSYVKRKVPHNEVKCKLLGVCELQTSEEQPRRLHSQKGFPRVRFSASTEGLPTKATRVGSGFCTSEDCYLSRSGVCPSFAWQKISNLQEQVQITDFTN
jgi:hypothetical protein